jgi:hypothetical protein
MKNTKRKPAANPKRSARNKSTAAVLMSEMTGHEMNRLEAMSPEEMSRIYARAVAKINRLCR